MKRRASALASISACGILLAAGCAGGSHEKPVVGPSQPVRTCESNARAPVSSDLLNELSILTTQLPADPNRIASIKTDEDLDRYIQALVDDERFAREVAPRMLIPNIIELSGNFLFNQRLAVDKSTGKDIYFIPMRGKCAAKDAVDVHPWWALGTTVKVCPSSYQPTHLRASTGLYCGTVLPDAYCGCGPNLAFCAKSATHADELIESVRKETIAIVARAVKSDAALDQMYVVNESERDRNAEFIYRRWRISSGERPDDVLAKLEEWPTSPVLAPRFESVPGQHAGVLTAAGTHEMEAGLRGRMKWFYDALWCDEPPAGGVTTEAVLSLKGNDLRQGDDWEALASRPICTECHARLDYGMRFFSGFGILFAYNPKESLPGKGKFFASNIHDLRGEARLDPRSFGELAVKQREFSACVVKKVKRHVLDDAWDTSADEPLDRAFGERHSLKALMREALRQHADNRRTKPCEGTTAKSFETVEAGLDTHCMNCHGKERAPDFSIASDPKTLRAALNAVAFGKMPKGPMRTEDRRRLVELLIQRVYVDEPSRTEARAYYSSSPAARVHTVPGLLGAIGAQAGAHPSDRFSDNAQGVMREDQLRYSPGIEAIISLEALAACKAAGHKEAALKACLAKATDPHNTMRAPQSKD